MASQWHTSFCQKQGKDSEFPYIQSFMALSQNPDFRNSCLMCLSVASLSPVPLCLSPSDFPDDLYLTFHIHMTSRKELWGSLWSRSFSYFQKPEGSKNSPNILKNSLLTTPISQWRRTKLPQLLQIPLTLPSSDGTKTSLLNQRDNPRFYQLICPWYQSQFEHYLVYILAVKLWLQKRKMTFWHRMAMIFFRLWRKLLKMKFFSWNLQNQFFLHMQLKTSF